MTHVVSSKSTALDANSFVYTEFVAHVANVQQQINQAAKHLENLAQKKHSDSNKLQSQEIQFIDPFGNKFKKSYFHHELIGNIINKLRKNYVPKYLQKYIKFGWMKNDSIIPIQDSDLKQNVAECQNTTLVTYVTITAWLGYCSYMLSNQKVLNLLVTDTVESLKQKLGLNNEVSEIQLRLGASRNYSCIPDVRDWQSAKELKSNDTVLSCELFQDNWILMVNVTDDKVSLLLLLFQ